MKLKDRVKRMQGAGRAAALADLRNFMAGILSNYSRAELEDLVTIRRDARLGDVDLSPLQAALLERCEGEEAKFRHLVNTAWHFLTDVERVAAAGGSWPQA